MSSTSCQAIIQDYIYSEMRKLTLKRPSSVATELPGNPATKRQCLGISYEKTQEKTFLDSFALQTDVANKTNRPTDIENFKSVYMTFLENSPLQKYGMSKTIGTNIQSGFESVPTVPLRDSYFGDCFKKLDAEKNKTEPLRYEPKFFSSNLLPENNDLAQTVNKLKNNIRQLEASLKTAKSKCQQLLQEKKHKVVLTELLKKEINEITTKFKADLNKMQDKKLNLEQLIATMKLNFEKERTQWQMQEEDLNKKVDSLNKQIQAIAKSHSDNHDRMKSDVQVKMTFKAKEQELSDSLEKSKKNPVNHKNAIISPQPNTNSQKNLVPVCKENVQEYKELLKKLNEPLDTAKKDNLREKKTKNEANTENFSNFIKGILKPKIPNPIIRNQQDTKKGQEKHTSEIAMLNKKLNDYKNLLDSIRKQFEEEREKNERLNEHLCSLTSKLTQAEQDLELEKKEASEARDDLAKQKTILDKLKLEQLETQAKLLIEETAKKTLQVDLNAAKERYEKDLFECKTELSQLKQRSINYEKLIIDYSHSSNATSTRLRDRDVKLKRLTQESTILNESRVTPKQLRDQLVQEAKCREGSLEEQREKLKEADGKLKWKRAMIRKWDDSKWSKVTKIKYLLDQIRQLRASKLDLEAALKLKTDKYENLLKDHNNLQTSQTTGKKIEKKLQSALKANKRLVYSLETVKRRNRTLLSLIKLIY